jgi:hypothetical protein
MKREIGGETYQIRSGCSLCLPVPLHFESTEIES